MNQRPTGTNPQECVYLRAECAVFWKTREAFGGLSNMAGGYPLLINGVRIPSSEALYQACRFPHRPDLQRLIIGHASPMAAKMAGKPYRDQTRADWDAMRVPIMRWCLRVKLALHWERFAELLRATGDRPIVELSYRDSFWGARPDGPAQLVGVNTLGRLLMQVREWLHTREHAQLLVVKPLRIVDFLMLGQPIGVVTASGHQTEHAGMFQAALPLQGDGDDSTG